MVQQIDFTKNPDKYVIRILFPNKDKLKGTGFFCHPEGYILTCYHVIESYLNKNKTQVKIFYQGKKYQAEIEKYFENLDIALLKIKEKGFFPYLPLDIYERWKIRDEIFSFGYPKGYFEEPGNSATGVIEGITKIYGVKVHGISDFAMENIKEGYSGAPVWHLRINKVIGLISMKYTSRQAFFVPLGNEFFENCKELREFHDIFERIRLKLAEEAKEKLKEKLKDTEFIPLNLERKVFLRKRNLRKKDLKKEDPKKGCMGANGNLLI